MTCERKLTRLAKTVKEAELSHALVMESLLGKREAPHKDRAAAAAEALSSEVDVFVQNLPAQCPRLAPKTFMSESLAEYRHRDYRSERSHAVENKAAKAIEAQDYEELRLLCTEHEWYLKKQQESLASHSSSSSSSRSSSAISSLAAADDEEGEMASKKN